MKIRKWQLKSVVIVTHSIQLYECLNDSYDLCMTRIVGCVRSLVLRYAFHHVSVPESRLQFALVRKSMLDAVSWHAEKEPELRHNM